MTHKGIPLHDWEVRGLLEHGKVTVWRPVRPQPTKRFVIDVDGVWYDADGVHPGRVMKAPFTPGEVRFVRETWWNASSYPVSRTGDSEPESYWSKLVHYATDGDPPNTPNRHYPSGLRGGYFAAPDPWASWHKRPRNAMPLWAARLWCRTNSVTVKRLSKVQPAMPRGEFEADWERRFRKFPVASDPWSWEVELVKCEEPK